MYYNKFYASHFFLKIERLCYTLMMFNRYVIEHIDIQFKSVTRVFKF